MTPGKIELQREKTRRLEQSKEGRCLTLAPWRVETNVDIVNVQSYFPIFSLAGHFFYFQTRWVMMKEVFLLTITRLVCKRD